jgi:hypothetical protein
MSGIVDLSRLAREGGGALAEAYSNLGRKWTPELQAIQKRVGEFYQGLTSANPEYFATSKEIPKGADPEIMRLLAKKHGFDPDEFKYEQGSVTHRPTGTSIGPTGDTPLLLAKQAQEARDKGQESLARSIIDKLRFSKVAGMGPSSDFLNADLIGADSGTGMARKLYPFYSDWLMAHPGTGLEQQGITGSNLQKKAMYQLQPLEKYGEGFMNRSEFSPGQLDSNWGQHNNVSRLTGSDLPTQVGALNMAIGNNTNAKIHTLLQSAHDELGSRLLDTGADTPEFKALLAKLDRAKNAGLTTTSFPSSNNNFQDLSSIIRDISGELKIDQPVGYDSLRRMGITNDVLRNPDMVPQDIPSELTKGLARARGGLVTQSRTPRGQ